MRSLVRPATRVLIAALSAALSVTPSAAQSTRASPEKQAQRAVKVRQSLFQMINYGYAPIGEMLKNNIPFDADTAQKGAALLVVLAPLVEDVFRHDTRQFNLRTWASDDIWIRAADFKATNASFVAAASALAEAAKRADKASVLQAAANVGRACKACHDAYTR